jgi:hypothetical protein
MVRQDVCTSALLADGLIPADRRRPVPESRLPLVLILSALIHHPHHYVCVVIWKRDALLL